MRFRYFIMIIFLILSCEEKTYENPLDPDTELSPDEWAPNSLSIEILTDSDVKLSWVKSEIEATGFKVERQDTTGGAFLEVGLSDTTIYTDTGLLTGNEYLYQVCAYSGDNKSAYTTSSDTIRTSFPSPYEMSAVPQTDNKIELTWSDSTAYESGFVVWRLNILSDVLAMLDSTAENTYQDTTVTLGNEYIYSVGAYSQYNTSSYTNTPVIKYWQDCLNIWGGTAEEDNCGTCDSDPFNDCDMDCAGNWGGDLVDDSCGVCGGENSPLTGNCDCNATPNGVAYIDGCGDCVGGLTGSTACANDCLGELGGDAVYDNCNTCDNDASNDCTQDCAGTWGGDAQEDNCGVCDSDSTNDNVPLSGTCDCAGIANGDSLEDECGTCDNDASNDCTQDCAGTWGGSDIDIDGDGICDNLQGTISDVDGNTYKTIKIGDQNWMAENLKTTKYKDGSDIITGYSNNGWGSISTGAYAVYDDDPSNADIYGNLYNWYAVDDNRGLCMDGWHVPTDDEWRTLEIYLGMSTSNSLTEGFRGTDEGNKLKKSAYWPGLSGNNESGFSAVPGGKRLPDGYFGHWHDFGTDAYFWTQTTNESSDWKAAIRHLNYNFQNIWRGFKNKNHGYSIRCLKD